MKFTREFSAPAFNGNHIEVDQDSKVVIKNIEKINDFEAEFNANLFLAIYSIFNEFNLFRHHYVACQTISEWRFSAASPTERDVWDNVFCGGEGLYYTLLYSKDELAANQRLSDLRNAVNSIEARLSHERVSLFQDCSQSLIDQAFDSVRSKAFQVGLFMALEKFRSENALENLLDACEEFLQGLNQLQPCDWVNVLTEIKSALIPGVDPKSWPAYQKLILRAIQTEGEFYNAGNFMDSPDGRIFSQKIEERFNSWLTAEEIDPAEISIEELSESIISSWALNAKEYINDLFGLANIAPIEIGVDHAKFARDIIERLMHR